jgi:hypothetical protein
MEQLVDVAVKFYSAEGDTAIIDAMVEAVATVLSIDNVRLIQDEDDDILTISAGRYPPEALLRAARVGSGFQFVRDFGLFPRAERRAARCNGAGR